MRIELCAALACLPLAHAAAQAASVTVRGGEHDGYSRIVFTVPAGMPCRSMRIGDLLILTFPKAGPIPGLAPAPANILSVAGGTDQAAIGVAAGMQTHVWQIDRRIIVDVFTPPAPAAPQER